MSGRTTSPLRVLNCKDAAWRDQAQRAVQQGTEVGLCYLDPEDLRYVEKLVENHGVVPFVLHHQPENKFLAIVHSHRLLAG